jgi:acetyl-CoA C-acetyltransferase
MAFSLRLAKITGKNVRFYSNTKKFNDVVIVAATRTPIGSFQSSLSGLSASQLGGIAVESAIKQAGIPKEVVDEVVLGNVISAGLGI